MELTATLPTEWADVPLLAYCKILAAEDLTLAARVTALAELVQVAPEELVKDMRTYAAIRRDLGFLDTLPEVPEDYQPGPIEHARNRYEHVGNLDKINAGQLEHLLDLLEEYEAAPTMAAPAILAVLYCPSNTEQTREVVQATQKAFETLPMSVAWPALGFFLRSLGPSASSFLAYSAVKSELAQMLETVEATLSSTGDSRRYWQRVPGWLTRRWIQSVRGMLNPSASKSSTAGKKRR